MIWPFGIIGSSSLFFSFFVFFGACVVDRHSAHFHRVCDLSPAMDRTGRYSILLHSIMKGWESDMVIASLGWVKNHFWIRIAFRGQRI